MTGEVFRIGTLGIDGAVSGDLRDGGFTAADDRQSATKRLKDRETEALVKRREKKDFCALEEGDEVFVFDVGYPCNPGRIGEFLDCLLKKRFAATGATDDDKAVFGKLVCDESESTNGRLEIFVRIGIGDH